jgi:copper chaperone
MPHRGIVRYPGWVWRVNQGNGVTRGRQGAGAAATDRVDLPIEGMTCGACQLTIEGALGRLPGVRAAAVDLAARTVPVTYDEAMVPPATIRATLADQGYEVAG